MKWTVFVCSLLVVQAIVASASLDNSYESQLEQLQLLQERQAATEKAFQETPEGFSFKQTVSMDTAQEQTAGTGANPVKLKKLAAAMSAVKDDIMAKLREAQRESSWVKEVEGIVKQYKKKVKNVKKNLTKIRQDIKMLIKKKRQIRNAQIQEQLQDRLVDADGDLKMVTDKLSSIKAQQKAFENNRKKIATTIAKIKSELSHLRGEKPKKSKKEKKAVADKKKKEAAASAKKAGDAKKDDKKSEFITLKNGKKIPRKTVVDCKKKCNKDKKCVKTCVKDALKAAPKKSFIEASVDEDAALLAEFSN